MKTVFFSSSPSIVRWAYTDVINDKQTEYCEFNLNNGVKKRLYTRKIAKITPFFLKKLIYRFLLGYDFLKTIRKNEEVLFIFTCQYNMLSRGIFYDFVKFLKRRYKKSKLVFYYNDIVETCSPEKLNFIKQEFDVVLSFDKTEAYKYGIEAYEEVYSVQDINKIEEEFKTNSEPSDVFFVGGDRGRFDLIIDIFKKLADENKKVIFFLFGVLEENVIKLKDLFGYQEGQRLITYKNSELHINEYCPYPRTLSYISKTKCMVEITLSAQTAPTLRLPEATVYHKKIITNCATATIKSYYKKENILFIENLKKASGKEMVEFINSPMVEVDYDFSPLKMVKMLQNRLFKG